MHQALRVGRGQPTGRLHPDSHHLPNRKRTLGPDAVLESDAADEFHHQEGNGAILVHGVDVDDVFVADGGGGLGLAGKPPAGGAHGRQRRGQQLDRDHPPQLGVVGLEHHPHPAAPDHSENLVVVQPADRTLLLRRRQQHLQVDVRCAFVWGFRFTVRRVAWSMVERPGGAGAGGIGAGLNDCPGGAVVHTRDMFGLQELLDPRAQNGVAGAGFIQECGPDSGLGKLACGLDNLPLAQHLFHGGLS